jgi:glycosyltransferase involved in cell wall biosynthesis
LHPVTATAALAPDRSHKRRDVHILLFEMSLSGHHANYLEHIAQGLLSQGHRVTASVLDTELNHPVLVRLREQHSPHFRNVALPPADWLGRWLARLGVAGGELAAWRMFKRFYRVLELQDPVDRVFYPYLDYCLHATALMGPPSGSAPWAAICMRPSFHLSRAGVVAPTPKFAVAKERLFWRLLSDGNLKALFTIDELLWREATSSRPNLARRLRYLADPAVLGETLDRSGARARLNVAPDEFIILVYGAIDGRKGVDLLLDGIRWQTFQIPVRVLLVGKQTEGVRKSVARESGITSLDRYVDCVTEEAAFRAADLVWLGYRSHYAMSGVLILAAMAGVPVLATNQGLIGWMTREHALGDVIDVRQASEVSKCLLKRTAASTPTSTPGMYTLRSRHTWDKALRDISDGFGANCALQR